MAPWSAQGDLHALGKTALRDGFQAPPLRQHLVPVSQEHSNSPLVLDDKVSHERKINYHRDPSQYLLLAAGRARGRRLLQQVDRQSGLLQGRGRIGPERERPHVRRQTRVNRPLRALIHLEELTLGGDTLARQHFQQIIAVARPWRAECAGAAPPPTGQRKLICRGAWPGRAFAATRRGEVRGQQLP
jgi:hypothetical protein